MCVCVSTRACLKGGGVHHLVVDSSEVVLNQNSAAEIVPSVEFSNYVQKSQSIRTELCGLFGLGGGVLRPGVIVVCHLETDDGIKTGCKAGV